MKKLVLVGIIAMVLVISGISAAQGAFRETAPRDSMGKLTKRVIADSVSREDMDFFRARGCLVKHRLREATSLECPEEIVPMLNVREARVFHIMDLAADQQIGADSVWAEGITGSGVNVAVLDTGIDTDHPELQDSYLGGYDFVNNDADPEDDQGHGTHVAGIITANGADPNAKGVSPSAGIYMYKVCNANGECYEDDMAAAMEAAVATDAKVMSMSIGGGSFTGEDCDSDSLAAKVNWVVSQGLAAVVAAGNDGRGVSSPGCASGAIAVGAVDSSSNVPFFSGRGPALDIVAPGVNIYSSVIGGYNYMSGTSMATPHVAGVAALLLETKSDLTTDGIKTAMYDTASTVNRCYRCTFWWGPYCYRQAEVSCTPDITGAGVVDAYGAYLAVKPSEPDCINDTDCDDSLYCNGAETCVAGTCQAGTAVDCSGSGDQCNSGFCDENNDTCLKEPANEGLSCDDGLFCNAGETCQSGMCMGGSARDCSDGEQCTSDVCNEDIDACENPPVADGTGCEDGMFCTVDDVCASGVCGGSARDCSDGVECTVDTCDDMNDTCISEPDNTPCDNSLFCDGTETCNPFLGCESGTPVDCSYLDDQCGAGFCDESSNSCLKEPANEGLSCEDGQFCTISDVCTSGVCDGSPLDCSDNVSCTVDTCDESSDSCENAPDNGLCSDGLFCNGAEVCNPLVGCESGTPVDCNDFNECTLDSCSENISDCENIPVADNVPCTGGICCSGACSTASCSADAECDDGDACTADTCENAGACAASCSNEPVTQCISGDGCCPAGCDYASDTDCPSATLCWSGSNEYLYRSRSQARKFCKCAEGTYGYNSYSYEWARRTVYQYADSGDNENWDVTSRSSYLPVYRVKCSDGNWYNTNQDYYYG